MATEIDCLIADAEVRARKELLRSLLKVGTVEEALEEVEALVMRLTGATAPEPDLTAAVCSALSATFDSIAKAERRRARRRLR